MASDGFIEVRAEVVWNGRQVCARQMVPANAWADMQARDQLKEYLRRALGGLIAAQLDVTWQTLRHDPWGKGVSIED